MHISLSLSLSLSLIFILFKWEKRCNSRNRHPRSANCTFIDVCGNLARVHSPLCNSEIANNSERQVWYPLYTTSMIRKFNEQSLTENYFYIKKIQCLFNRYLRTKWRGESYKYRWLVFSSPEPKAQVSFSDQNLSFVRRRRCRCRCFRCRKLFTFSTSSPEPLDKFH